MISLTCIQKRKGILFALLLTLLIPLKAAGDDVVFSADKTVTWISEKNRIVGMDGQTGEALFTIDVAGALALAIDEEARILWVYKRGELQSYQFNGQSELSVTLNAPNVFENSQVSNGQLKFQPGWGQSFEGKQTILPVPGSLKTAVPGSGGWIDYVCGSFVNLAVDQATGHVWLGLCGTLYHYNNKGEYVQHLQLPGYRFIHKMAINSKRGLIWVATGNELLAYDESSTVQQRLSMGWFGLIKDVVLATDQDMLVVATNHQIRLYHTDGERKAILPYRQIKHLAWDKQHGIWALGAKKLNWIDLDSPNDHALQLDYKTKGTITGFESDAKDDSIWLATKTAVQQIKRTDQLLIADQWDLQTQAISDMVVFSDHTAPDLIIRSPITDSRVKTNQVLVEWISSALDRVADSFSLNINGLKQTVNCEPDEDHYRCLITVPEGEVVLLASLQDTAGNEAQSEVKMIVDSMAPDITAVTTEGALSTASEKLVFSIKDQGTGIVANSLQVQINGTHSDQGQLTGERLTITPTVNWSDGPLTISVEVKDSVGNVAQRTFNYSVGQVELASGFRAEPRSGVAPLQVQFMVEAQTNSVIDSYHWDFTSDGQIDNKDTLGRSQLHVYQQPGQYEVTLKVIDNQGRERTQKQLIQVNNSETTVWAKALPSNGGVPLNVTFSVEASDHEGIASYEWDFEGDGVIDHQSNTTGKATHTYTTVGTYRPRLRVTDQTGGQTEVSVPTTVVRGGEPGSPSVSATLSPAQGKTPLAVNFKATATPSDVAEWAWDFDGDGQIDQRGAASQLNHTYTLAGHYYPRVIITNKDGQQTEDRLEVKISSEVSFSLSTDTINADQEETLTVTSKLGGPLAVQLTLEDNQKNIVSTLLPFTQREAGEYQDIWSGHDDQGKLMKEGIYYLILSYREGETVKRIDLREVAASSTTNIPRALPRSRLPSKFAPFAGNPLEWTFTLSKAAEVTSYVGRTSVNVRLATFLQRQPLGRGTHKIVWNSVNGEGMMIMPMSDGFSVGVFEYALAGNAVYLKSGAHIDNLTIQPLIFDPTGHDRSQLKFTLNQPADVMLEVLDVDVGKIITTQRYPDLSAGEQTIEWNGQDSDGILVGPGNYRLGLKAIDAQGYQSRIRAGIQRIYY